MLPAMQVRRRAIHTTADGRRLLVVHGDDYDGATHFGGLQERFGDWLYYRILTGNRLSLQPPVENYAARLQPQERAAIGDFLAAAVIGGPDTVRDGLTTLAQETGADELILVCDVYDPALRLRSLDIAAQAHSAMGQATAAAL